jgi:polysaccharide deacetylase family protein (PEP-CTERM system associated)
MNILSFDIEDWWIYDHYKIGDRKDWLPRLDRYLNRILDLLDERKIKATFFVLGEVAANHPDVVKCIDARGHHMGCHSFSHSFLGKYTPEEVRKDTIKALQAIEDRIGRKVNAYRAPAFSITEHNKWVFPILAENGIEYDCSIFPAARSFGGFPAYKTKSPAIIEIDGHRIKEFPMATAHILGRDIVYSGGGYFRLFPYWKIKSLAKNSEYVMTYFHIKDFDKQRMRSYSSFEGESAIVRYIKEYYGLSGSFQKFCKFVSDFDFLNLEQADKLIDWNNQPVVNL